MIVFYVFLKSWFVYTTATTGVQSSSEDSDQIHTSDLNDTVINSNGEADIHEDIERMKKMLLGEYRVQELDGPKQSRKSSKSVSQPSVNIVYKGIKLQIKSANSEEKESSLNTDFFSDHERLKKILLESVKMIKRTIQVYFAGYNNFQKFLSGKNWFSTSSQRPNLIYLGFDAINNERNKKIMCLRLLTLCFFKAYNNSLDLIEFLEDKKIINFLLQLYTFRMLEINVEKGFIEIRCYTDDYILEYLDLSMVIEYKTDSAFQKFLYRHKLSTMDMKNEYSRIKMNYIKDMLSFCKHFLHYLQDQTSEENKYTRIRIVLAAVISLGEELFKLLEKLSDEAPGIYCFAYINDLIIRAKINKPLLDEVEILKDQNVNYELTNMIDIINQMYNDNDFIEEVEKLANKYFET